MKIKPLADRLLVKPIEEDDRTPGGIILPDTASKEKPMQGKIVAAGPGKVCGRTALSAAGFASAATFRGGNEFAGFCAAEAWPA